MKRLIIILTAVVALASRGANAQELYQYAKDSVITTSVGQIYILNAYDINIGYSHAIPVYNKYEPATCSDPMIKRNEYGAYIVDKTKFNKPSQYVIHNSVTLCFFQYRTLLKTAFDGNGKIGLTFHTNSVGVVQNIEVKIWAESAIYRQIPPEVLCRFLNVLDDLQFGIPTEYQCISDHYFRYSVFFKDL
jgi:hypothetical protein